MAPRTLPRFTFALCLGTLAGMLAMTLYGAWLVRAARLEQSARSLRLHDLGQIVVPHPDRIRAMGWREELGAGLFYGLTAGWTLGGLAALALIGLALLPLSRRGRLGGLLFLGILLSAWLWEPQAVLPTLLFSTTLPWLVAGAVSLGGWAQRTRA